MCFQQLLSGSELHFLAYVNNFYLGSFIVMLFANVLEIDTYYNGWKVVLFQGLYNLGKYNFKVLKVTTVLMYLHTY